MLSKNLSKWKNPKILKSFLERLKLKKKLKKRTPNKPEIEISQPKNIDKFEDVEDLGSIGSCEIRHVSYQENDLKVKFLENLDYSGHTNPIKIMSNRL